MIETAARALVWGFSFAAGVLLFVLVLAFASERYEAARIQWSRRAERKRGVADLIAASRTRQQEPWKP
jgi:hypothetical protein